MVSRLALIGAKGDVPLFYHSDEAEDALFANLKQKAIDYNGSDNIFDKNPKLANMVAQQADKNAADSRNEAQYGSVSVLSEHEDGKPVISRLQIGSHPPANSSTYTEIRLSDGRILRLRDVEVGQEGDETLKDKGIKIFSVDIDGIEKSVPYDDGLKKIFYLPPKITVKIKYDRKIKREEAISLERARLADQYTRAEELRELTRRTPSLVSPFNNRYH